MGEPARLAEVVELPSRRAPLRAAVVAMRPRQWLKNLLLFAGIIFAAQVGDPVRWLEAGAAFIAYCAGSSAAYLVNDLRDAPDDRLHPVKRRRPIARGEVREAHRRRPRRRARRRSRRRHGSPRARVGRVPDGLRGFAGRLHDQAQARRSDRRPRHRRTLRRPGRRRRRRRPGEDLTVAARLHRPAGALSRPRQATCRAGARRRRANAGTAGAGGLLARSRRPAAGRGGRSDDRRLWLYSVTARESYALVATVPFVVFGLFRYLQLLHRHDAGEEPENVLLGDVPILVTVAVWAVACAAILLVG